MSSYFEKLVARVIDHSESSTWRSAVVEWDLFDCEEDESASGVCTCGKEGLRYLYTIRNHYNGHFLYPIGSCCIKKFNRSDLSTEINIQEQMFRLLHAIRDREFIPLTPEFFSRKLLLKLKNDGAFVATVYNNNNGDSDYDFLLDMFNKRDKTAISPAQIRKINGVIAFSIKPFLEQKLARKIRLSHFNRIGKGNYVSYQKLFDKLTWERGVNIVGAGGIYEHSCINSIINAAVQGKAKYKVIIHLNDSGYPLYMACTCPHANDGYKCKHMAATLLFYQISYIES